MRALFGMSVVALASAVTLLAAGTLPRQPAPVAGDAQDLVILHPTRPWRVRLHLQVAGRSFRESWDQAAGHLFRHLDSDGDGKLSKAEAARAPNAEQWQQMLLGTAAVEPGPAPEMAALAGGSKDDAITPAALSAFYRRSEAGPVQAEWGPAADPPDGLTDPLFRLLDRDGDGKLSRAELLAATDLFARADQDGDEMITGFDLLEASGRGAAKTTPPATAPTKGPARPAPKGPGRMPFLLLDPADRPRAVVDCLVRAYDRDANGKLSREEIGLEKATFEGLDADKDGQLNDAELAHWRDLPADLLLHVELTPGARAFQLLPAADGKPGALGAHARVGPDGALVVTLPGFRIELVSLEASGGGTRQALDDLRNQFRGLAGKAGVLTCKEMFREPFTFVGLSRLADRNGDGKLTEKELDDYLGLMGKVVTATTFLTGANRGKSLFEMLDVNRDSKLSRRELLNAWQRLSAFDLGKSGTIARDDLPRQYLLTIGHGRPPVGPQSGPDAFQGLRPAAPPRGPLWFRKMDLNGDGDLSPAEFLGTPDQFRSLDTDKDGLISVEEAEKADAAFRKKR